jgi:cytochrome oxidase Cu insertion factor (SCO1/SenC/PrrC family)
MTRARLLVLTVIGLLAMAAPGLGGSLDPFEVLGLVSFESGIRAPDFTLRGLKGEPVSLSSSNGSASLVVFWATW